MTDISTFSTIIKQLLQVTPEEVSARLKQRLIVASLDQGLGVFDEGALGFAKFREFLETGLRDLVDVRRPEGHGDLIVSLKPEYRTSPVALTPTLGAMPALRGDVWQAFTNLDASRRRFINKKSFVVRHYLTGAQSESRTEIETHPTDFVEISPIARSVLVGWMKQFLDSTTITGSELANLQALTSSSSYVNGLNETFSKALGEYAPAWRQFRAERVFEQVRHWANESRIPFDNLLAKPKLRLDPIATPSSEPANSSTPALNRAIKLLETLTEQDIDRLVLPMLATVIYVKHRV